MLRRWWLVGGALVFGPSPGAVDLHPIEYIWLQAAKPVLSYAREQRLPLDIIVQPQPTPGQTPMGMAYVDGRCKLVLSMRGNPEAQGTLDRIPRELTGPVVEAIAAHELGHCWRHLRQRWGTLPAGVSAVAQAPASPPSAEQSASLDENGRMRREEAYADLVGLAWTLRQHRSRYAEVHDWHVRARTAEGRDMGHHDTVAWVRLAGDPAGFAPAASIFEQVEPLWKQGLLAAD